MEITMNVKVKAPETQLDGIPDFLKRASSTDPAAPTAEVAANAIAIIEQALDLGATREDVEKAEVAADSTEPVTEPTTEETNMTKTTKKVKALKAAKAPKVPQAAKAPKAAGPHDVAAFTRAAAKGKAPKAAAAAKAPKAAKARKAAAAAKAPKAAAKAPRPGKKKAAAVIPFRREGTKQAIILSMLAKGTTVAKIMEATDWQPHTVRGFLAAVVRRKLGLNLESEKTDGERVYRVTGKPEEGAEASTSAQPEAA
jgi:Protein of unknown function (DUF3489)